VYCHRNYVNMLTMVGNIMVLPIGYSHLEVTLKYTLTSYMALSDARYAISRFKVSEFDFSEWKVGWAGICSLLKSSLHLMRYKDAKSCLPDVIRQNMIEKWNDVRLKKSDHPLFWEFIDRERNNILKQYQFSASEAIVKADGSIVPRRGLLYMMGEDEKSTLMIKGGHYDGRQALEVAEEAARWVENTIFSTVLKAGFDPEEKVKIGNFLTWNKPT
jgi:hypothetical protein